MKPLVYIILVNYNGFNDTIECVSSINKINYDNYKIIIVDNNSTDESKKILLNKFDNCSNIIMIFQDNNIGFAGGNNIGINFALKNHADYVLLLNNDTIVTENFLTHMVTVAEKNQEIGCIGGKIYYYDSMKGQKIIWYAGGKINKFTGKTKHIGVDKIDNGTYSSVIETDYITGCLMLIKSEVIRSVGLMNEEYFLYYEETDWCARMKKKGYKLLVDQNAIIYHKVSRSMKTIKNSIKYYYDRNSYYFIINNYGILNKAFMFFYKRAYLFLKLIKAYIKKDNFKIDLVKKTYSSIKNREMGKFND